MVPATLLRHVGSERVGSGRANDVVLKRLGSVVVISSRLEHLAAQIARNLKLSAEPAVALASLQRTNIVPPPWSTTTARDITAWANRGGALLETRDRLLQCAGSARFTGTRGDTIVTESADGTVFPADEEFLIRFVTRLERLLLAGTELDSGLDYHDEKGQRWPLVTIYSEQLEATTAAPAIRLPVEWQRWLSA